MADDLALDDPEVEDTPEPVAPPPASSGSFGGGGRTVLALWLPTPSRRRLIDADLDIVEDADDNPSLILASTRGPAARRSSIRALAASAPVVVVCHPGGEAIAAEMVALGACAVVAEGSEGSAVRVLDGEGSTHMVDAYLSEVDRSWAGGSALSLDPVTGLTGPSGFELRLAELGKDGGMPRLGLIDLDLDGVLRQIGPAGHAAMKRRLAVAIAGAAGNRAAEMFDLGPMLAVLAGSMPAPVALSLGAEILEIGATFMPNGEPIEVAVGWAGPEAASDAVTLRLLADRALEVARSREPKMVDAEELSQHSAASIELSASYGVADAVDALDSRGDHSVRVSEYAADLARELQLEPGEVAEIGLAARLHDVGKAVFGASAFDPASDEYEEARAGHPERGEKFVLPNAGPAVAAIVRAHHERWDGTGFPDAKAGNDIPIGARILAVAHHYDDLANAGTSQLQIEEDLRSEGGQSLDPDLVEAAIALFGRG
jgi:hypothetical protein